MAVETDVLSPKSSAIKIEHLEDGIISWKARAGQTHFEIQYRAKTSSSWSTLGKIPSNTTSYPLIHLYKTFRKVFDEMYYRIVLYYDIISGEDRDIGYEYSDVYHLVFLPTSTGEIEEIFQGEVHKIPLYDNTGNTSCPIVNVRIDDAIKQFPIVERDHSMAGKKHITLHGKDMAPASGQFRQYHTGMYGTGVWDAEHTDHTPVYGEYYTTNYSYVTDRMYHTYQYSVPKVTSYRSMPHYKSYYYAYQYAYTRYQSYVGYANYLFEYTNRGGAPLYFDFYRYRTITCRYYSYGVYQYSYNVLEHIYYARSYMETFYAYINYRYTGTTPIDTVSGQANKEHTVCDYYYNVPLTYTHYLSQKTDEYRYDRKYVTGYSKHYNVSGYTTHKYNYRYYT